MPFIQRRARGTVDKFVNEDWHFHGKLTPGGSHHAFHVVFLIFSLDESINVPNSASHFVCDISMKLWLESCYAVELGKQSLLCCRVALFAPLIPTFAPWWASFHHKSFCSVFQDPDSRGWLLPSLRFLFGKTGLKLPYAAICSRVAAQAVLWAPSCVCTLICATAPTQRDWPLPCHLFSVPQNSELKRRRQIGIEGIWFVAPVMFCL